MNRSKVGWKLGKSDMTSPKGESMTVPGQAQDLREILRQYTSNTLGPIGKEVMDVGEMDFDDQDFSKLSSMDLFDREELHYQATLTRKEAEDILKARKLKEAERAAQEAEDQDRGDRYSRSKSHHYDDDDGDEKKKKEGSHRPSGSRKREQQRPKGSLRDDEGGAGDPEGSE